jgi:hypothetical protein
VSYCELTSVHHSAPEGLSVSSGKILLLLVTTILKMLQYGQLPNKMKNILLKNSVRFGHFQFYAGQFDGLNQPVSQDSKNQLKIFNRIWEVVKPQKLIWISIEVNGQVIKSELLLKKKYSDFITGPFTFIEIQIDL